MQSTGSKTFIPEEKIREIRESVSIIGVISDYVSLKKKGANYQGLCPFHQEKTPSFSVNENKNFFYCFGCHESGDVFSFLMKKESLSFNEAAKMLAERVGIVIPEKPLTPQQVRTQSEKEELFEINKKAAKLYNNLLLKDSRAAKARQYLEKRSISTETIHTYELGYAPDSWDTLTKELKGSNKQLLLAQKTGLIVKKDNDRYYDRFRNRIIFPIINLSRNIAGFGGRIIDKGEPKYLNSPESVIYSKRHTLYGLPYAVKDIKNKEKAIIVEGYLDVLSLHQVGIKNSVAPLGTALTEYQIQILSRYTQNIITVFDSDPSGVKAMIRSLEPFLANNIAPYLVLLPENEDPDSFVRTNGETAFMEKVNNAEHLLDFVIEKIIQKNQIATPRGRTDACDEIIPLLKKISDAMERDIYIQKISRRMNLKEEHIRSRMENTSAKKSFSDHEKKKTKTTSASNKNAEQLVLQLMLSHPKIINIVDKSSLIKEITDTDIKEICSMVLTEHREKGNFSLSALMEKIEQENFRKIIAENSFENHLAGEPTKILEDCIKDIRLKKNIKEQGKVRDLLRQAEAAKDENLSIKYLEESQKLLKEKKNIHQLKINT